MVLGTADTMHQRAGCSYSGYSIDQSGSNGETVNESTNASPWGRVDEANSVFVREGDSERMVGQYPDGTAEEALAYFVRKFADIEGQIHLLEQRINTGSAGLDISQSVATLTKLVEEPAAVGDIQALRNRVRKLQDRAEQYAEKQRAERAALKEEALGKRELIVAEAERIANMPEGQIRWKDSGKVMDQLFSDWQDAQRQGPQINKADADVLWKRFRTARTHFDAARRRFFSQMDSTNKEVKQRKEKLISAAEALAAKGVDGIPQYRSLLDDWKAAGRASRKVDDQLWARFKAAGDVLYEAKAEEVAQENVLYEENLVVKRALLEEAEPILKITDHETARKQLTGIQLRWDEAGRVPRESLREIEGRLRAVEEHVRKIETEHWEATNPETIARSEGLKGQLEASIAELTEAVKTAETSGDAKRVAEAKEKLATQESWLKALS